MKSITIFFVVAVAVIAVQGYYINQTPLNPAK